MTASSGLRERKKLKTRRLIRHEALRLFMTQGYERTTIEQIAEASEVSVSTLFRYFGTKEDVVLTGDYAPLFQKALTERPLSEPFIETLRTVVAVTLRETIEREHEDILARTQLMSSVPVLQARYMQQQRKAHDVLMEHLRVRCGDRHSEFELVVAAGALIGVTTVARLYWAENNGKESLVDLVDRALQQLGGFLNL